MVIGIYGNDYACNSLINIWIILNVLIIFTKNFTYYSQNYTRL